MLKFILFNTFAFCWKILPSWGHHEKIYKVTACSDINRKLYETGQDVMDYINKYDMFILQYKNTTYSNYHRDLYTDDKLTYCYSTQLGRSYTKFISDEIDVRISPILITKTNTMFNVILHEFTHMMGLDHSDESGLMNYTVKQDSIDSRSVKEDNNKLWLSSDDLDGLKNNYILAKVKWCIDWTILSEDDFYLVGDELFEWCMDTKWIQQYT